VNYQKDDTKRLILSAALVGGLVLAWSIGRVQGQSGDDKVVFVEASKANFTAMSGGSGGVTTAPIRGDATTGAFAAFTIRLRGVAAFTSLRTVGESQRNFRTFITVRQIATFLKR
jgi:hypothetical protein